MSLTEHQFHVLEWFCKEVAKAIFLEILALALVPTVVNVPVSPPLWMLGVGLTLALTFLLFAVILAGKSQKERQ